MNIRRKFIPAAGFDIPCVTLTPANPRGSVVVIHGYGGCKEEQLGLAWRICGIGLKTFVIDLRGHGEHTLSLDHNVLQDVETSIEHGRALGKVAAVGHSLGGRLCLISSADFSIGISPALKTTYSADTRQLIDVMRGYRVRESLPGVNFEILTNLPVPHVLDTSKALLLFGSRDVPEIVASCKELKGNGAAVIEIHQALHNDIFLLEETFGHVVKKLAEWFGIR
ncbi:MAG TPA: alpha/beta fold hydrolase [Syntrophorhabdales bacterium]|nr:alpha/beta fold hydrolase [Syntrophorhabdales bacterium]